LEIKTLAKNTIILASPKVLAFAVGILKSKLIAVLLGTTGFGIIEQLTSTINFIRNSTLSFMPHGMIKLIASEKADRFDKRVISEIIKTYFLMIIPVMLITIVLSVVFANQITVFIFGDLKYKSYFLFGILALPISFLGVSFTSILKAFKEIKSLALAEVYLMIINLVIFVPFVYYFGVKGGVIYVVLTFLNSLLISLYLVNKNVFKKYKISIKKIRTAVFSNIHFKELLTFIGVGIIGGTFLVVEDMASRAIVVNQLGIDMIGVYSPITKWQALFIGFILPSIYTYIFPRLSEAKSDEEVTSVINDVIRIITFVTLPFIIVGISTRQWIIPLFYSKDFMEATIYLPYHFAFLIFAVWAPILGQIFAPTGRLKIELIFIIIINSLSLFLVYYFVPKIGLYGYLLRFTVTPFITVIAFYIFWNNKIKFRLKKENIKIIVYAIFCSTMMVLFKDSGNVILSLIGLVLLSLIGFMLKKQEKEFILKKLKKLRI